MPDKLDIAGLPTANFDEKAVIFLKDEPADVAYVLIDGEVAIMGPNAEGVLVALTTIKPGEMFGEMALLANSNRTAMAVAEKASKCVVINRDALAREISKADPFIRFWIAYMSDRLVDISKRAAK
ncbi:MAG: cyclic nucleotide-binding domain-containing protein [Rhodobacteraceae bacterium]|nr:cyclic nucleotide-binding domain-containing protein [Paracoccaceae bacterium]